MPVMQSGLSRHYGRYTWTTSTEMQISKKKKKKKEISEKSTSCTDLFFILISVHIKKKAIN